MDAPVPGATVFATDRLHVLTIVVAPQYLDALDTDLDNRVPCALTFDGATVQAGIRKKGGYGSNAPLAGKTGFSLRFDGTERLDGLARLILNNAQEDPTFLSETIGYLAYRAAGLPAPLTSHAVVTFNGEDKGIFIVKEPIGRDFLERNFGASNTGGNVYEGFYHPADLSLGDFATHPEETDLKDEVSEMRSRADLNALAQAIRDTPDAQFEAEIAARLDLDRYITGFALDTILGFWDSYAYFRNNYYLYHLPTSDRFVYVPHGMDQLQYSSPGSPVGLLAQRIRSIATLDARVDARIASLRAAWPQATLATQIDQVEAILSSPPAGMRTSADTASFRSEVADVRARVRALGP